MHCCLQHFPYFCNAFGKDSDADIFRKVYFRHSIDVNLDNSQLVLEWEHTPSLGWIFRTQANISPSGVGVSRIYTKGSRDPASRILGIAAPFFFYV